MESRERIAQLAQQAAQGSREAFNDLYLLTRDRAFFVAYSITKDEEDALDILQDSYLKAWQRMGEFRPPWEFPAWLNRITGNTAKDFIKRRKPYLFQSAVEDEIAPLDLQEEKDREYIPDAAMDTAETRRLILEIVDDLPEDQRLCVLMYYYDDIPLGEIAATLEIPYGTVMSRLALARRKISNGVEALEKKGTKLYGAAPIALLIWLLRGIAGESSKKLPPMILKSTTAAGTTASGGVLAAKIVAGVAAAVIVAGGVAAATRLLPKDRPAAEGIEMENAQVHAAHPFTIPAMPLSGITATGPAAAQAEPVPAAAVTQYTAHTSATQNPAIATTASTTATTTSTSTATTVKPAATTTSTAATTNLSTTTTATATTTTKPTSATTASTTTTTTTTTTTIAAAPVPIAKTSNGVILEYLPGALPANVTFTVTTGAGSTTTLFNTSTSATAARFTLDCRSNSAAVHQVTQGRVTIYLPVPAAAMADIHLLEVRHFTGPFTFVTVPSRVAGSYLAFETDYI